ncbi:MAG: antibiotic biosynthesis monooxygenase [Zetaproteobacteria bacterium CG_4_9_14_3_um_filter_49_83]|nr:MAG: antibiotic biosynthesis monooxygenase [Zetaproteobacteria bacterium CG17_big_fil_post_rev_8_21_14_2_50_50_13]PIV29582.1 MAG: antibiotic biosynthesis monooxygenase [Zetaproteobacteria bacterium CG02_land_8_20_14_3_00_50_9]PIY56365.1 MAG: antibiotic biosynthesis monooxygenase [Zetaproteobacteria bacterium CG_4_10_14_0_8_um_filter_49_80]PJA34762.1 MAG: antibiotic biosynthesis monooxygenase [Zetaproteobacteria bacterium CG_4_9_14_3_um_filter_49_83]
MFVTMNRFTIDPQYWDVFEDRFRQRAGLIDKEPGFIRNTVLRPQEGFSDQHIVMTLWESREAFEAWTKSDSFRQAHAKAGQTPKEWYAGPNKLEIFESVTDSAEI